MTDELTAVKQQIVAAVQQQLTQYSEQVRTAIQGLRDEIATERTARTNLDEQLRSLASGLETTHQSHGAFQTEIQRVLDERLTEFGTTTKRRNEELNQRLDRVVDEANVGLAAAVESATRPVLREVEHRQTKLEGDVTSLDKTIRKFDDQAARMVTHINDVTGGIDGRFEQLASGMHTDVESRMSGLSARLDEMSAQSARHQSDVSNIVGQRVDEAESRMNDKIATAEARINDDVGTRIADIDAYVGRVSVGLDEGIVMLNDRFAEVNGRFEESHRQILAMEENLKSVDIDAIDEMKDKVASAAGEAMLVRIEMERLQETLGATMDKHSVRLTELETQMQDQAMDTETAVQLERLEEVERALIALDPAQFVRVDGGARGAVYEPAGATMPAETMPAATSPAAAQPEDFAAEFSMAPLTGPSDPQSTDARNDSMASFAPPANS